MDNRGKQQRELYDGAQDCAQLFHLPLRVPNAMFDGLDDDLDDMPIDVGTTATAADPATTPEQPEWNANTFGTNAVFDDLGVTFADGVPVVPSFDDEPDTPQVVEVTTEYVEEDNNNCGSEYARDLPVPSMEGYPFRQPALDTVFREMFENLQMQCSDMRAPVNIEFVELKSLIIRSVHAGHMAQIDQLEAIIGPIIEEHTLIAYGLMYILTNGARDLMDLCDWYTFRWMRRTMWHSVFPRNSDECLFNL
jgi:hypothetical protein